VNTEWSEEQIALRESVGRFLAERASLAWVRERWDAARKLDGPRDPVWRGLVELGLPSLLVPEALGGAGCGMIEMGAALETMGRFVHPGPLLSSAVGATSAALAFDAEDLVRQLARGDVIGTLALEEAPEARTRIEGGRICGAKTHVADAFDADFFVVTAGDVWLVERDATGVSIEREDGVDGTRVFATLRFDAAFGTRLGPHDALLPALDRVDVAHAADGLGAAQAALDAALGYARVRRQFGAPIGSFQAVAHLLVDMLHAVELGRGAIHHALWSLDTQEPAEAHRAALVAAGWAAESFVRVAASAIQVFGGIGFTWEHDAHLYYKRLLTLEQRSGGAAARWDALAEMILP
jgi:alkylation response protein AidB-like acyl-CoA dehydrogenase